MSILDWLRPNVADTYSLDQLRGTEAWDLALDRVAEALTNPTDEQVKHLTDHAITAFAQGISRGDGSADDLLSGVVRAVLAAAAAGGDQ